MSQKKARAAARAKQQALEAKRRKARRTNLIVSIAVVVAVAVVVGVVALTSGGEEQAAGDSAGDGPAAATQLVRPDSYKLGTAGDGKVTLVEFLDFECEACRAAFPIVEQLRETYQGRVTFVARYFPIPSHFNAERAARAVEAAGQQDQFEPMYKKMYETQEQWSEQQVPKDDVFRGFAQDLGLDMAKWDKDYNDPATLERIKADVADGQALGVQGTPTFFLNGEKIEPKSADDFTKAIDAALAS